MATAWFEPSSAGSLLQQYSPDGKGARRRGNATTRSAMLRANCIRLNCYLNCEVERRQQKLIAAQNRQELNAAAREKADRVRSGSPKRPKSPSGRAKSARPVVQAAFSSSYSWA